MILSNEPGYYKAGAYGIRIENLVLVVEAPSAAGAEKPLNAFETLTLAPIDRRLIDRVLLTTAEVAWLDTYHARVAITLSPLLDAETQAWLAARPGRSVGTEAAWTTTAPSDCTTVRAPTPRTPWGLLILLMAMTAIGPTTLNILVPALPELAHQLGSKIGTVQLTVSVYLLALAGGQLVMGPLSDRYGRRPVLLIGLALAVAASLLAIVMSTVGSLILARIAQAIGASAGIVIGRAIIRDLFDRDRAASMIGLVATVMVVVPTLGPLIGGLLDTAFGWEAIFVATAASSLIVLVWSAITLPETSRLNVHAGAREGFFRDFVKLSASAKFAGYVLAASFGSATFFAFLGGGPYVIVTLMGRTSAEYGVWFAISSIGYMAGNFAASRLSMRFAIDTLIWWGIAIEVLGVAWPRCWRSSRPTGDRRSCSCRSLSCPSATACCCPARSPARSASGRRRRAPPPASPAARRWRSAPPSRNTPARCWRARPPRCRWRC